MNTRKPNRKNLIWFSVLAIVISAGIFAGVLLLDNQQGYRTITVFETEGSVSVVNNGIEYQAYPGMVLQEGYAVVTSANSYVRMVLDGDKYVKLEQGSRATFETLGLLGSGKTKIQLERGTLTSEIVNPLKADEEFVVNTTNAVLAVRGTFFRVTLQGETNGEIRTDVYTYGGKVASKRILPNGEVVEEEVLIDAGYKASVSMSEEDTVYLTENVAMGEWQEKSITPIVMEDISNEDLVDMYFASDNGHELFVSTAEIEKLVEDRAIILEEYTPPYEKAEEAESGAITATTPDDNRPLVQEEPETEEEPERIADVPTDGGRGEEERTEPEGPIDVALGEETGAPEEERPMEPNIQEPDIQEPEQQEPEQQEPEQQEPEEEPNVPGTSGGADSGNIDETPGHVHTEVTNTVDATCTQAGMTTVSCSECGEIISETELVALGHDYASDYTTDIEATCTDVGSKSKHCSRCDATTDVTEIAATGHAITYVGTVDVHGTCDVCGTSTTEHDYMDVTIDATCSTEGETTYTCNCGYFYTEAIPMLAHTEETEYTDGTDIADGLMRVYCSVCNDTIEEETLFSIPKNFTDDVFAAYVAANFDVDGHNSLNTEELADLQAATTVNLAGTSTTDGGVTSLYGISNFTSLTDLNCAYNAGITTLNLSGNTGLATLNIEGCSSLTTLDVSETALTGLDLSSSTSIAEITAQNCPSLLTVECTGVTTLNQLDVGRSSALMSLNVSGCTNLSSVTISNCTALEEVDVSSCSQLVALSTDLNPALKTVNISNCDYLEIFNFERNANLTHLWMDNAGRNLDEIDLSANTELLLFSAKNVHIERYDFNNNTKLEELYIGGNTLIQDLIIRENLALKKLDISNCTSLWYIFAGDRYADLTELEAALESLDATGCGTIYFGN